MNRREFLLLSGGLTASGILSRTPILPASRSGQERPNILFIAADDLRPELGCCGVEAIKSPNIDRLARRGVVFSRAYCQQTICNPSRASLLTGKRPDTIKVWDLVTHFRTHSPYSVTLPQIFKHYGYQSVGIGKIFHDFLPDPVSWTRSEPEIKGAYIYQNPKTRALVQRLEAAARALGKNDAWLLTILRGPATEAEDAPENKYWDGALTDLAIKSLGELKDNTPFFLAVGFFKPHLPYVAPKKYWDLYNPEQIPLAKNNYLPKGAPLFAMNEMYELSCYEDFLKVRRPSEGSLSESQVRLLKHGYYACLSFIDAQIGRLLDEVDRLGLGENTIIVLWGDHGCKLGEHGGWGKRTNYETDTRSVLIISAPGAPANGKTSPALVEFVDVYPTLCELAGISLPSYLEGTSMVPLLQDPSRPWKIAAFSQSLRGFTARFMGRSIRTDRYRYVEWRDWIDGRFMACELYDHLNDPDENLNIAERPENQELVKKLAKMLSAGWRAAKPK